MPKTNQRSIWIFGNVVSEIDKRLKELSGGAGGIDSHTAPDVALREGDKIEAGHNSKVVGTALERLEQIGILLRVCIDDPPIGEHNLGTISRIRDAGTGSTHLEVDDVIADKAIASGEEGISALGR